MYQPKQARIIGTGTYLPETILTNSDLEKLVDTSDEWIVTRTGIKERRIAGSGEFPSTMGAKAAKLALAEASLQPSEIDIILVATMTPDFQFPSTAALIQHQIGAAKAAAVDLQAACAGFIYALSTAKAYVESGIYQNVLVVATEKMSAFIDYQDRNTCVLFGDGAAAAVVSHQGKGLAISAACLGAQGGMADLLSLPAGGAQEPASDETLLTKKHYLKMQGKELFKHAVRLMSAAGKNCLEVAGIHEQRLTWLVPHQANERIIDACAKAFAIPAHKVFKTIHKYGNTSASSIPIALNELKNTYSFQTGDHTLLLGFGAGLTYGAALLTQL